MWWEPSSLGSDGGRRQLHGYPFYYLRQSMCEALVTMMDQIVAELRPLDLLQVLALTKPDAPLDQGPMTTELQPRAGGSLGAGIRPLGRHLGADGSPCTLEGETRGGGEGAVERPGNVSEAVERPGDASEAGRVNAAARLFVAIVTSSRHSSSDAHNCSGLIRPAEGPVGSRSSEVVLEEASGSRQGDLRSDPAAAVSKRMMMVGSGDLLARLISMLSCRELAAMLYQVGS